jgi:trans-aconitate methyltransferase
MKIFNTTLLLVLSISGFSAHAQVANDAAIQQAIISALPKGVTPEKASVDEIAQAATTLAFNMEGNLEANVTQVMVSLGELSHKGLFKNTPRFGENTPTGRFYTKVLNMASSNVDVASKTYYSLTVQDIMRLTAAAHQGMDFLYGAKSNPITRK